jgi:TP901 family phage tail tape measure protein
MTMPGGGGDRQANVTVTANVDPYVKSINAANAATLKFADALQKVDQQVLKIAKIAGAGAMAVGGAGLLKAFGDVKTASALEDSFKSLSAQATITGTNVGKVTTEVVKLGTQIPVATQSLAAMATQIAALGVQGTNNLKMLTRQAEELAAATNTAPGQLMTGLLQLNQSLGGSIENISRYGSALTALQAKMGVASSDVLSFMQGIEAVGAKAGVTEQQMMGMSAAFVKVGADGFAGAQAFNSIVNDMSDAVSRNSPRMQQYATLLGMTSDQFKSLIQSGNSAQAFVDFINAVSNSGARASLVLEQFGLDSVRTQRVFAALTSGQANLAQAMSETNTAFSENTAMASAAAAAWDGFDSQLQRIKNSSTQLKNELGAPLLGPLTMLSRVIADVGASFGNFVRFVDDAPWPIGDTLTSLVTKTPALLLLGGAFLTVTAAVSRFAGAWRMMTGAVGINAFRGFMDGRAGNTPRELGNSGRLGSMLYRRTYQMNTGDGLIGSNARRGVGSMIMGYPFMRARQQLGQAVDTMRHPFAPELRDPNKTDPFSAHGMWQAGSRQFKTYRGRAVDALRTQAQAVDENGNPTSAAQHAAILANRLERGFGPMEDSKEALQRRRFDYVERARVAAVARQQSINATMSPSQLRQTLAATELGQHIQEHGSEAGFQATNWNKVGDRQLLAIANNRKNGLAGYAGANAATSAGKAFDASLTEEETNKLANPFAKLASKVKTISKELLTSTGSTVKTIMDSIVAFYQSSVAKIEALAAKARDSIATVYAYANPDKVARMTTMPRCPVPRTRGRRTSTAALHWGRTVASLRTITSVPPPSRCRSSPPAR